MFGGLSLASFALVCHDLLAECTDYIHVTQRQPPCPDEEFTRLRHKTSDNFFKQTQVLILEMFSTVWKTVLSETGVKTFGTISNRGRNF